MITPDDRYTISLPPLIGGMGKSPTVVTIDSPEELRDHVELFARYFLREMHTGGIQFEAGESAGLPGYVPYKAYLFHDRYRFFGACCFRWREWQDAAPSWSLDWLWLHPYFRAQGHLSQAWPTLVAAHGQFHLAKPSSPAMKAFLQKVGHFDPPQRTAEPVAVLGTPFLEGDSLTEKSLYFLRCLAIVVLIPVWVPLLFLGSGVAWICIGVAKLFRLIRGNGT